MQHTAPEYKDAVKEALPEQRSLPLDRLIEALADTNADLLPTVITSAFVQKIEMGETAFPSLMAWYQRAQQNSERMEILDEITELLARGYSAPEVTTFLWSLLNDPASSPFVKTYVGRALAVAQDEEFVLLSRKMLEIADLGDIRVTIRMIGFCRDEESVPMLIQLLNPHNLAIADALVWALGEIGSPEALPVLHAVLELSMLSNEVIEALGKIGHVDSMPSLLAVLLGREQEERELAAEAIVRIVRNGQEIPPKLLASMKAILERAMDHDESRVVRYFCLVTHGLLGGTLVVNRVLTALNAVMTKKEMSSMSSFFIGRPKPKIR